MNYNLIHYRNNRISKAQNFLALFILIAFPTMLNNNIYGSNSKFVKNDMFCELLHGLKCLASYNCINLQSVRTSNQN